MNGDALEIVDMTVQRGATRAVDRVSVAVPQAKWFGLIGANGSGKTSLLRAIAGRVPCVVASCRIEGEELCYSPAERAARLGFMPTAESLPAALCGRQLLNLIAGDEVQWREGARLVANAIGLEQLLDRRIGECSAGMRQRVAIACAFAANQSITILDEPFNWLDPVAAFDLRAALRGRVDEGLTLVTALHDMLTLVSCDQGLLLGEGRVAAELDYNDIVAGRTQPEMFEKNVIQTLRKHSQLS